MRNEVSSYRATTAAAAIFAVLAVACRQEEQVPTYEVTRRSFAHWVKAEGFLRAVNVTEVSVPSEIRRGARILWMVEDGARVEAGDPVVKLDHYDMEQRYREEVAESEAAVVELDRTRVEGRQGRGPRRGRQGGAEGSRGQE